MGQRGRVSSGESWGVPTRTDGSFVQPALTSPTQYIVSNILLNI